MPLPTHAEIDKFFDDYLEGIETLEQQFRSVLDDGTFPVPPENQRVINLFNGNKNRSRDPANTMRVFWKTFVPDTP